MNWTEMTNLDELPLTMADWCRLYPIDKVAANQVLWMVSREGYPPGHFNELLIEAMLYADPQNLARLSTVFPDLGMAVRVYRTQIGGMEYLRSVAAGSGPVD